MSTAVMVPPAHRPELLVRPLGDKGQVVVKDLHTGSYYNLGQEEAFLLDRLDGVRTGEVIRDEFEEHFGGPLTEADLQEFLELAEGWGLLQTPDAGAHPGASPPPRSRSRSRPRQS